MKTKKQKNKKTKVFGRKINFFLLLLFIFGAFLAGFFGIKIFLILLTQPILSVYNAAYNLYVSTGDAGNFRIAASFAKSWLQAWIFLILGIMLLYFRKAIKNKMEEND